MLLLYYNFYSFCVFIEENVVYLGFILIGFFGFFGLLWLSRWLVSENVEYVG